jgi:hypothetical protein
MTNLSQEHAQVHIRKCYKKGNSDEMRMISEVIGMVRESFEILLRIPQEFLICLSFIISHNNFDSSKFYSMKCFKK